MRSRARELSGGNQQKIAFGRSIGRDAPGVMLMNEPTRGVDVGARAEIYRIMREFCAQGYALVMTSSDLEEIIGLDAALIGFHRCVERHHGCGIIRRGVVVGDGATDRAAITHGRVAEHRGQMH